MHRSLLPKFFILIALKLVKTLANMQRLWNSITLPPRSILAQQRLTLEQLTASLKWVMKRGPFNFIKGQFLSTPTSNSPTTEWELPMKKCTKTIWQSRTSTKQSSQIPTLFSLITVWGICTMPGKNTHRPFRTMSLPRS